MVLGCVGFFGFAETKTWAFFLPAASLEAEANRLRSWLSWSTTAYKGRSRLSEHLPVVNLCAELRASFPKPAG